MSFKAGDKVVPFSEKALQKYELQSVNDDDNYVKIGQVYTISGTYSSGESTLAQFEEVRFGYYCDDLVLEEVYNSPLYKALNES